MVVVPTLLTSVERVSELLEHLEVLALGNLDPRVHFAILSDFTDAPAREMPQDEAILGAARAGVEALNARHAEGRNDRFYLVHRVRQWNPARGRLHGLGAQARQDRGVEPPPARSHGHELLGGGRRRRRLPRRPLLHHPRLRHAPAAGRREEADRHRRPPAEPAPLRPAPRPRHRGLRDPPAPRERDHGERRRLAVRAALRRAHRRRPLHDRGLRHVPGPLRRGDLHRQGALRRGRVRGRPRGARARERPPLARPLRGAVRAHRPRHRHRGRGRLPGERPRPRAPPAPLGARRLADPVVAVPDRPHPLRPAPQPPAAHLPLEDPRQPETQPDGARDRGPAAARVDDPPGKPLALDGRGPGRARLQPLSAGPEDPRRSAAAAAVARLPPRGEGGREHGAGADRPAADVPREPGLGEGARDRPDPRPAGGHEAPPAGVGDGRGERRAGTPPQRRARVREGDDREPAHRPRRPRRWWRSRVRPRSPRPCRCSCCGPRRRSSPTP